MASKRINDILQAAVEENVLNEKGELYPWSSPVFQNAAEKLNLKENCPKISRDYLYIILKNNRYNLLDTLRTMCGVEVAPSLLENLHESDLIEDDEIETKTVIDEGNITFNYTRNHYFM